MATPKLTVTLPDGSVVSRRTARPYLFAVAVDARTIEAQAAEQDKRAAEALAHAEKLEAAAATGKVSAPRSRGFHPSTADLDLGYTGEHSYHNFTASLSGYGETHCDSKGVTETHSFLTDAQYVTTLKPIDEALREAARSYAAAERERAAKITAKAAALRDGSDKGEKPAVLRWTTRLDLAASYQSAEFASWAARGHVLTIVPVN